MPRVHELTTFLDGFAPRMLAETWDNVGLLLGDVDADVQRVMTCLTLTSDVAAEAVQEQTDLIVTHHPILFRPVQRITSETVEGAMLLTLAKAGIAVYSPHTAFDSTADGVNARIATRLGLENVQPIRPLASPATAEDLLMQSPIGAGRYGTLREPIDFAEFLKQVGRAFDLRTLDAVPVKRAVTRIAVACGSAAEFLPDAVAAGCDALVTGEARFHAALDARTAQIALVLLGHYASERFAVEELAEVIQTAFPMLTAWPSRTERDPLERFPV